MVKHLTGLLEALGTAPTLQKRKEEVNWDSRSPALSIFQAGEETCPVAQRDGVCPRDTVASCHLPDQLEPACLDGEFSAQTEGPGSQW